MTEPMSRWSAAETIGRGVKAAPALRLGFGATFFNAAQRTLDELCGIDFAKGARVVPSRLADDGPLIGAAAVGWRGLNRNAR